MTTINAANAPTAEDAKPLSGSQEGARAHPREVLFALRAIAFACDHFSTLDELNSASRNRLAHLLGRFGHPNLLEQCETTLDLETRLMATCQKIDIELQSLTPNKFDTVTADLKTALRLDESFAKILQLALYSQASDDLKRSLNIIGEVDDDGVSRLLEGVLSIESSTARSALLAKNPLMRMSANDVPFLTALPTDFIRLSNRVAGVAKQPSFTADDVLSIFFRVSPPARLTLEDFKDSGPETDLMLAYLRNAIANSRCGVNILLFGPPGTGKSELVRSAARSFGATLREVPSVDEDRDPLPPWRRLTSYTAAQEVIRERNDAFILFDEAEDIFPQVHERSVFGSAVAPSTGDRNKGWITQVLETNHRPTVWISNTIEHIDPAFLRRFDMVVEIGKIDRKTRGRIAERLLRELPVAPKSIQKVADESALSPGHIERIAGVLRILAPENEVSASEMLDQLSRQAIKAMKRQPAPRKVESMPFRLECINADTAIDELTDALEQNGSARLCLYGPPGTGKSAWAQELANRVGKLVTVKRGSDLLGRYVGETEKLIRRAFAEAARTDAALIIDEIDSLLSSRDSSRANWETSMVNELLTSMEGFDGLFIASTNVVENLDPASARRFDFKIRFGELTLAQANLLYSDLLNCLGHKGNAPVALPWPALRGITAGDFANVFRQARIIRSKGTPEALLVSLEKEVQFRNGRSTRRPFGFA